MELIFEDTKNQIVLRGVVCPVCARKGDVIEDEIEPWYVWCTRCRNWFELGFQIHSGD